MFLLRHKNQSGPVHIFFRMVMNISGLFSMITILINGFGSLKDKAAFSVSNYVETSILTTIFSWSSIILSIHFVSPFFYISMSYLRQVQACRNQFFCPFLPKSMLGLIFSGRKIVRKDRRLARAISFDRRRYMTISELFRKIREDKTLCEALGRLMADEIDKEIDEAVRMARTDGYSNGFLTPYVLL